MGRQRPRRATGDGLDTDVRVTLLLDSPNLGGAEVVVTQLARHLETTTTVVAAAPVSPRLRQRLSGHAEMVVVPPVGTRWRRLPALAATLRRTGPDVVHVNAIDPRSNRVLLAAAQASGAPTAVTCHMEGALGGPASRRALARLYRRTGAVIAVSGPIAAELSRLGVAPDRLHIVRNGVDIPEAAPAGTVTPDPTGRLRVVSVGRLTRQKGHDLLITALGYLRASGHDVELVIAGEGRDRDRLAAQGRGLPVTLLGHVDEVPAVLATADVVCLPSRAEGLPLALLEAMAAGCACVATDVGDVTTAVGDAAVVVPPQDVTSLVDALATLFDDRAGRQSLGTRARQRSRAFDVRRTAAHVTRIHGGLARQTSTDASQPRQEH